MHLKPHVDYICKLILLFHILYAFLAIGPFFFTSKVKINHSQKHFTSSPTQTVKFQMIC